MILTGYHLFVHNSSRVYFVPFWMTHFHHFNQEVFGIVAEIATWIICRMSKHILLFATMSNDVKITYVCFQKSTIYMSKHEHFVVHVRFKCVRFYQDPLVVLIVMWYMVIPINHRHISICCSKFRKNTTLSRKNSVFQYWCAIAGS